MNGRAMYLSIEKISISDLAVAYASQTEIECWLVPPQGYAQYGGIKIKEMRRTKKPGEHVVAIDYFSDLNGPGEDSTTHHAWRNARIRYNQNTKKGKEYWLRSRKKKQTA